MLLENKNAVIYGAGGAVGSAVARAFAREGAKVFLAGRTLAKVETVAREISATTGVADAVQVVALDEQAIEKHISKVVEKAGSIDILFNAIGMQDVQGLPLVEMPLEDFTRPITIATRTQFLTARAFANLGGFDVACAAIESLWRSFAAELGLYGIRLVVIGSAGSPDTPDVQATLKLHARATGKSFEEVLADSGNDTLLGRLPSVTEVANVATLMASDYASAMTGVIANVTCGYIVD